jgi:hypothetical protein
MPMDAERVIKLYDQAKALRQPHEQGWRTAAAHCLPALYSQWLTDGPAPMNQKAEAARRVSYDTTGARSLLKYASVLNRLITPDGQKWHGLMASDPALRKKARVRAYFDELTNTLFKMRYDPKARFKISMNEVYKSLGVFGNGPVYIGERRASLRNPVAGFKYVALSMRDMFFLCDDDGEIVAVFRRFWLNMRQFKEKFPGIATPPCMEAEAKKPTPDETTYFEFVHYVCVAEDYEPGALDRRRHPWHAAYISVKDKAVVGEETGYRSMPYKIPRTETVAGDAYGYSPAVLSLAALGTASQIKKTVLKQGNKAVDPVMLASDDNAANGEFDQRPGAINYGAIDRQGRELVKPLRTGDFRVAENLLADERRDIEDSFFVTLFQILTETPEMTATEVMERTAEKAALLAPTMGRAQSELSGPGIEREIDIATELGKMPDMPPELVEAQGEYEVVYTSPLARSMYAEEVSGFMRSVEMALNVAQATQDLSLLDHYDFDTALPEIAEHMSVPARWMADPDKIKTARGQREEKAKEEATMKNAPALASAAKTVAELGGRRARA